MSMLNVLRQLMPDEARQVARHCGARPGAMPEEIIRALGRATGACLWGIFPVNTAEALLDQVGRRLGMAPLTAGAGAAALRERAILACYLRHAWDAAERDTRDRLLRTALGAWDNPTIPPPELMTAPDHSPLHPTLEALLQQSAGCRALAVATESVSLPLPSMGPAGSLFAGLGGFTVVGPAGARSPSGHQAFFGVLLVLWRARARLLRERRLQRVQLERQVQQMDGLLQVRRKNLTSTPLPWTRNPQSGMALTLAAGTSAAIHLAIAGGPLLLLPTIAVGAAGLAWSMASATRASRITSDERMVRISGQIHSFRSQLTVVEREIAVLEAE